MVDNVIHYAVDYTPAMYPHTVTNILSQKITPLIDQMITGDWEDMVRTAMVIENGEVIDKRITEFRSSRGLK